MVEVTFEKIEEWRRRFSSGNDTPVERAHFTRDEGLALLDAADLALELDRTFEMRWEADMRAVERWRKAHPGNENVLPDHADLVVWLLEELDAEQERAEHFSSGRL